MRRITKLATIAGAALIAIGAGSAAHAEYRVDPVTGEGFVGKGDVQTALTLSNAGIQAKDFTANFTMKSTTEQSFDWTCVKTTVTGNGGIKETRQERANVTTTDVTAVVSSQARVKNQITGFNLLGFGATTTTSVVDGPAPLSCPDAASGFELDVDSVVKGDPIVTASGLHVNGVLVPIAPAVVTVG